MTVLDPASASAELPELDVQPLSGTIGAVIRGLDLRTVDDATVAAIRRVWLDHKVVFFPTQDLTPAEHVAFAARFGQPTEGHPVIPGIKGQPEVFEIDYTLARKAARKGTFDDGGKARQTYGDLATRSRGISWHTDVTFVRRPPLGSILRAVEVPESGGDTMFSDQNAAFEGLSPTMQTFLSGLTAIHDGKAQFQGLLDHVGEGRWDGEALTSLEPSTHPVVRTHPETGARSLFVNPGFTRRIVELSRAESDALLAFLYEHAVKPEYTVRYHWSAGDVGFWDNRTTQHMVVGDFGTQHRVIQRVTLRGDEPR